MDRKIFLLALTGLAVVLPIVFAATFLYYPLTIETTYLDVTEPYGTLPVFYFKGTYYGVDYGTNIGQLDLGGYTIEVYISDPGTEFPGIPDSIYGTVAYIKVRPAILRKTIYKDILGIVNFGDSAYYVGIRSITPFYEPAEVWLVIHSADYSTILAWYDLKQTGVLYNNVTNAWYFQIPAATGVHVSLIVINPKAAGASETGSFELIISPSSEPPLQSP